MDELDKYFLDVKRKLRDITTAHIESKTKKNPKWKGQDKFTTSKFPKDSRFVNNIRFDVLNKKSQTIIDVIFPDYAEPLSEGIKPGTKVGVQHYLFWVKSRRIQFKDKKGRFLSYLSTAIIIAKSIRRRGMTGYKFLDSIKKLLAETVKQDVDNTLLPPLLNSFDRDFATIWTRGKKS
jgi:hypothetical protein